MSVHLCSKHAKLYAVMNLAGCNTSLKCSHEKRNCETSVASEESFMQNSRAQKIIPSLKRFATKYNSLENKIENIIAAVNLSFLSL